jgi:hypothetical protein
VLAFARRTTDPERRRRRRRRRRLGPVTLSTGHAGRPALWPRRRWPWQLGAARSTKDVRDYDRLAVRVALGTAARRSGAFDRPRMCWPLPVRTVVDGHVGAAACSRSLRGSAILNRCRWIVARSQAVDDNDVAVATGNPPALPATGSACDPGMARTGWPGSAEFSVAASGSPTDPRQSVCCAISRGSASVVTGSDWGAVIREQGRAGA